MQELLAIQEQAPHRVHLTHPSYLARKVAFRLACIKLQRNFGTSKTSDITLFSIAGKIVARILLNRLVRTTAETLLPENQCGCRVNRSTADMTLFSDNFKKSIENETKDSM
ncbi:unnamed protein product [Brugia pahangi]|uniref:Ribonuclease P n=1 Tax=Brugia pahangi TaxID=6280 RepID=A0A0N4TRU2_BRUPA|nr:unnamed protein product [Brugia pahangi]